MAEKTERTSMLRKIPLKPMLQNVAAVGASTGLGYLSGGLISEGLGRTPGVRNAWNTLSPQQKIKYGRLLGGAAGAAVPLAASATHTATQAHLLDYLQRRRQSEKEGTKTASVLEIYELALSPDHE